ncbi:helix-hairpin-helix domain-containing protein [Nocardioides sp. NPDC092400]|uniref:helix-hairpin-helix domain-containing protein n=1 Tax=Nocardioides sp. NPDC092400 TaxID=3155196 RepID=UPI00344477F6
MRTRRATAEHQEAVARRLALLSAELAAERPPAWGPPLEPSPGREPEPYAAPLTEPPPTEPDWTSEHTRIRPRVAAAEPPPDPEPAWQPPAVPVPGRHAARRPRSLVPAAVGAVPETLRGRAALGSAQLTVVAVVVAIGLAVTCWWVVRGDPSAPVAPTPVETSPVADLVEVPPAAAPAPAPAPAVGTDDATAAAAAELVVDVAGKVRRPGIVVLESGARVVDALEAAGGARPGADLSGLNLARLLVDGEQVVVGRPATAPAGVPGTLPGTSGTPGTPGAPTALVDLNLATPVELEALPEVGPVTAAAIVAWREQHGGFSAVDELLEVDGIGEATLGQVRPYVTVGGG